MNQAQQVVQHHPDVTSTTVHQNSIFSTSHWTVFQLAPAFRALVYRFLTIVIHVTVAHFIANILSHHPHIVRYTNEDAIVKCPDMVSLFCVKTGGL